MRNAPLNQTNTPTSRHTPAQLRYWDSLLKLTSEQADEIREAYHTTTASSKRPTLLMLAVKYGVSANTIFRIIHTTPTPVVPTPIVSTPIVPASTTSLP